MEKRIIDNFFNDVQNNIVEINYESIKNYFQSINLDFEELVNMILKYDYGEENILQFIDVLICNGLDPNLDDKMNNYSLVHKALYFGYYDNEGIIHSHSSKFISDLIELLKKYGFDINTVDAFKNNVLHAALLSKHYTKNIFPIIKALGPDFNYLAINDGGYNFEYLLKKYKRIVKSNDEFYNYIEREYLDLNKITKNLFLLGHKQKTNTKQILEIKIYQDKLYDEGNHYEDGNDYGEETNDYSKEDDYSEEDNDYSEEDDYSVEDNDYCEDDDYYEEDNDYSEEDDYSEENNDYCEEDDYSEEDNDYCEEVDNNFEQKKEPIIEEKENRKILSYSEVKEELYLLKKEVRQLENNVMKQIEEAQSKLNVLEKREYLLANINCYYIHGVLKLICKLVSKMEGEKYTYGTFVYDYVPSYYLKKLYLRKESLDERLLESYFTRKRDDREFRSWQKEEIESSHVVIAYAELQYGYSDLTNRFDIVNFDPSCRYSQDYNRRDCMEVRIGNDKYLYILDFINIWCLNWKLENEFYDSVYKSPYQELEKLIDPFIEEYKSKGALCKKM